MAEARTARATTITQNIVLFILPVAILGLLALTLFFDFLGAQATELAKLINEIEIQCKADFWRSVGMMQASDPVVSGNVTCAQYLPKVLMFFGLLAVWCVVANVVTLKLFETIGSQSLRVAIAAIVTFLLPAILIFKYWTVIPFDLAASGVPAFTVLIVLAVVVFQLLFARLVFRHETFLARISSIPLLIVASAAVFIGLSLLFAYYPRNLFNTVGSINTIVLFVILTYAFLGGLFYYSRVTGFPVAAILLIWILAIDFLGINQATTVPARDIPSQPLKGDQQFVSWYNARRDKAAFGDKEYPVYIVASSGGGIYAAMRTAYFLDFLQKKCPAFAHHMFAISGVSGGGLGALTFASQQQSLEPRGLGPCNLSDDLGTTGEADATPLLDNFFSKDLLSTIVGAGLFPNMLQRVLPFPVPEFDRAEAFRRALGENWREAIRAGRERAPRMMRRNIPRQQRDCSTLNYFVRCEINAYWDPAGDVPVLIFNATEVDTGSPVVLSNLDSQYYANSLAARNSPNFENRSIYLIDGASLSARFPIALPAGFLRGFGSANSIRLVDGAYFDSSGLTIAQAVKLAVEDIAAQQNLKVKVRIIFLGEKVPSIYDLIAQNLGEQNAAAKAEDKTPRSSELGAHAKALLQARDQRAAETLRQVFRLDPTLLRFQWDPALTGQAETPCSTIPLAWYLAPCTLRVLKERLQIAVLDSAESYDVLRAELSPAP
jgi:hypothetical protein